MLKRTITSFGGARVLVIGYSFGDMDIGSELYRLRCECGDVPWRQAGETRLIDPRV